MSNKNSSRKIMTKKDMAEPLYKIDSATTADKPINAGYVQYAEITLDHATPAISIVGDVSPGMKMDIVLIQGDAGTAVADLSFFNYGTGTAPVVPLLTGEFVVVNAQYMAGGWMATSPDVTFP